MVFVSSMDVGALCGMVRFADADAEKRRTMSCQANMSRVHYDILHPPRIEDLTKMTVRRCTAEALLRGEDDVKDAVDLEELRNAIQLSGATSVRELENSEHATSLVLSVD